MIVAQWLAFYLATVQHLYVRAYPCFCVCGYDMNIEVVPHIRMYVCTYVFHEMQVKSSG